MNTNNTNTNEVNVNTNTQEADMKNFTEVITDHNEKEVNVSMKEELEMIKKLETEATKSRQKLQAQIALMEALKKAKTSGERDAYIEELAAKVAVKTVKAVKAVEKGAVVGTGYTMQYTGVALKVTSEQGVKAGSWLEQKGKKLANSYNDKMIAEARAMAAEEAKAKNQK